MHGISSVAGVRKVHWDAGERDIVLSPPKLSQFGEKESYILHLRNKRCPGLMTKSATAAHVTLVEEDAFDKSARGVFFRMWQAAKANHDEFKTDDIESALEQMADIIEAAVEKRGQVAFEELLFILNKAEQKDILGNSPGPAGKVEPNRPSTTEKTASPGPESTGP
ncbi:hypothetical protein GYB59_02120 [bacterium]|nr:hypothetical protein [bacterium]